jgi:hypothetical protein
MGRHPRRADRFRLRRSWLAKGGGNKSPIARFIDGFLYGRGWAETRFDTAVVVDGRRTETPTHQIDCFRGGVGLEIAWSNKDPFLDRDLNNVRLLFDLRALSVGVIVTRSDALQGIFNELGRGTSYGQATTHMSELLPRIEGGGAAGCPFPVFGITRRLSVEDEG